MQSHVVTPLHTGPRWHATSLNSPHVVVACRDQESGEPTTLASALDVVSCRVLGRWDDHGPVGVKLMCVIAYDTQQVLAQDTHEIMHESAITSVVYTGSNPENKKVVCFTTRLQGGALQCHMFEVKEKGVEIVAAISQAMSRLPRRSNSDSFTTADGDDGATPSRISSRGGSGDGINTKRPDYRE